MKNRIEDEELAAKRIDVGDAVTLLPKIGVIAFGGMAGTGYPKAIPKALSELVKGGLFQDFGYTIIGAGSATAEFDNWLSSINMQRRYPMGASSPELRKLCNARNFMVADSWLFEHARWVRNEAFSRRFGPIDVAIVEVTKIKDGGILVPTLSVDASASILHSAKKVILELNTSLPDIEGLHDIYLPLIGEPIPIRDITDRVGLPGFKVDKSKIAAIVESNKDDSESMHYSGVSSIDLQIMENLTRFMVAEVSEDSNLRSDKVTLQPGAGPIASAFGRRVTEPPNQFFGLGRSCSSFVVACT